MSRFLSPTALAALGLMAVLASVGRAQPRVSPWQRVKDPSIGARQFVQHFADHKREPRDVEHDTLATRTQLHKAAATWLERVVGSALEASQDPDLLLLYGECLAYAGPAYLERAQTTLTRGLQLAPSPEAAADGWNTLGRVRAALGQGLLAYEAFEQALALEWDRPTRTGIQIEQGLLAMSQGELRPAIERFTSARDASSEPALWALAQWGLGVAMDRALLGPEGASLAWRASQARFGANGELDVLALAELAPEPASEVAYYRALALMGKAQTLPATARRTTLLDAKFLWLTHVREAGPTGPFAARVRYHLAKIDELTTTPEDDADLERRARTPMQLTIDAGGVGPEDMLWPEELTRGQAFWSHDAGTPPQSTANED